jgi:hypothetical protein
LLLLHLLLLLTMTMPIMMPAAADMVVVCSQLGLWKWCLLLQPPPLLLLLLLPLLLLLLLLLWGSWNLLVGTAHRMN